MAGFSQDVERLRLLAPIERLPGRNATKADVLRYRTDGGDVAVKDYTPRPFWVRATVGKLLVRREVAAYRAAQGVHGVAEYLGRPWPLSLATRWVEGAPLAALRESPAPATFDRIGAVLDELHARGVALGDLHHRDVIVGPEGTVHVVDLATAWVLGARPGRLRRGVFRRLCEMDRVALARMRARSLGLPESQAIAGVGAAAARRHSRGRRLKHLWDRIRLRRRG